MKNIIIVAISIVVLGGVFAYFVNTKSSTPAGVPVSNTNPGAYATSTKGSVSVSGVEKVPFGSSNRVVYEGAGSDVVAVRVNGAVTDMKIVSIAIDGPELTVANTLKEIGSVANKTIYIKTSVPEGAPTEMLTWKSETGRQYNFIIGYNGETGKIDRIFEIE